MTPIRRTLKRWEARLRKMRRGRLEILVYHGVTAHPERLPMETHNVHPAIFRQQLNYLRDHYRLLSLRNAAESTDRDPGPVACISFDDGYLNNLREAYPVLADLGIQATLFVCPSVIDNKDLLWRDKIRYIMARDLAGRFVEFLRTRESAAGYRFDLLAESSFYAWSKNAQAIDALAIQADLEVFCAAEGIDAATLAAKSELYIARGDLREYEFLDIGNHTWSHPNMSRLSAEAQQDQIRRAHEYLVAAGIRPRSLAMPFAPYSDDTLRICRELGYDLLLTVFSRANPWPPRSGEGPLILHRRMAPVTLAGLQEIL